MIVLFTDFGPSGPYLGQMKAVLANQAPGIPVIDLFSDAPAFDPQLAAYLLAAYAPEFHEGTVFLAVVDPGVGSARTPLAVLADGRWYIGPNNGLLAIVLRHAEQTRVWEVAWRPECLSATFHGRDLFAPIAARLARGELPSGGDWTREFQGALVGNDWQDDLARIVYIDHYGNAMTGLRAKQLGANIRLRLGAHALSRKTYYSELPEGTPFWYENANGLVEIAVNRGNAAQELGLSLGAEFQVLLN